MKSVQSTEWESSSLATLVEALQDQLLVVPLDLPSKTARSKSIQLLLEGIEAFGIDSSFLLRHGMKTAALTPVLVLLLSDILRSRPRQNFFDPKKWSESLAVDQGQSSIDPVVDSNGSFSIELQGGAAGVARLLERWVERADLAEIINLRPPPHEFFEEIDPSPLNSDVADSYRWLAVRHSGRDFAAWDTASLRLEFLAREGAWPPPFAADFDLPKTADSFDLVYEIARRSAGAFESDFAPDGELFAQLQRQATQYLASERFAEAAALFEFYLRSYPSYLPALNNMAFCLIPIDVETALHHLVESATRGFTPLTVNIYNQCCCLLELGRAGEALELAEYHWQRGLADAPVASTLWRRNEGDWELYSESNTALALAGLAATIAKEVNPGREGRWQERVGEI